MHYTRGYSTPTLPPAVPLVCVVLLYKGEKGLQGGFSVFACTFIRSLITPVLEELLPPQWASVAQSGAGWTAVRRDVGSALFQACSLR
jgi:hypothetical protein